MPFLKAEPAGRIRSMRDFFALARAMELDAAARYTEAAGQLRQQGADALADVFERLAETERGHVSEVDQWAVRRGTTAIAEVPWPIPDTFDAPPAEVAQTRLMTPYRALASAVRHEQRSFAFWTYIAAHAETGEIKAAAERMALDELEHVSLLRRERRTAFHVERREAGAGEGPTTLRTLAAAERHLAKLIEDGPACAGDRASALSLAASARESAAKLEALEAATHPRFSAPGVPAGQHNDMAFLSEYLAEAYLRLAEVSQDAKVLGVAQELAKAAIYRLGMLNLKDRTKPDE